MKTLLLSIIFFVLLIQSNAQQIKFNKTFPAQYPTARTVFQSGSSFFLVGTAGGIGAESFYSRITAWKFDSIGNYLWEKNYYDTLNPFFDGAENACVKLSDGYVLPSTSRYTQAFPFRFIKLYRFNQEFDTLWTRNYLQDTIQIIARGVTVCSDGGFAIVGFSKRDEATGEVLPQYAGKGLLLRTDSMGNYLWHKTYGEWDYGNEFYKVVQTPDGGFLCGGATKSYSSSHNWDWYLVKTDSLGEEEWHRNYGSSSQDDSRIGGITLSRDTNYVITGGRAANSESFRPYIKVLDKNFNSIKTKILPYISSGAYVGQAIELKNGDFVVMGANRVNEAEITIVNMTKFDEDFNTIWRRQYTAHDTANVENYMASVDTCSDGGYVLGGWALIYDLNGQQLSIIKTDSLGCDGTDWWDCSTGVMIKEYANSESFKLYPNPANSYAVVEGLKLQVESIAVYDLMGKIVKTILLKEGTESQTVDVSDLKSGIYLVNVGERIEKLVVE